MEPVQNVSVMDAGVHLLLVNLKVYFLLKQQQNKQECASLLSMNLYCFVITGDAYLVGNVNVPKSEIKLQNR